MKFKSFISNKFWKYDVEDNAFSIMNDKNGVIASIHSTATQWEHKFSIEITCEKGMLILSGILSSTKSYGKEQLILINKKNLFVTNRNSDFIEAIMEFGALICKPKDPKCSQCCLNKSCRYLKSSKKIKTDKRKKIKIMNYNIFCFVNKKKQIALTKENETSFLKDFNLPLMKKTKNNSVNDDWIFLKNYKNSISNLRLNINLYYKFSNKIPKSFKWHSLNNNKEFIPSFTKRIFNQVSTLF